MQKAAPLFKRAKGCTGMTLQRSVEMPARYRLFVQWDTVENHTVDFRGSADFADSDSPASSGDSGAASGGDSAGGDWALSSRTFKRWTRTPFT